jgi:hypothetical protein
MERFFELLKDNLEKFDNFKGELNKYVKSK